MSKVNCLTNHFLVAMPSLADSNFSKAVIYLYEHNDEGALGMVINRTLDINLGNVLQHLDINTSKPEVTDYPVLMGGPVGQEHGFIIFERDPGTSGSKIEVFVSASKDMLKKIAEGKGPSNFMVALGYSGWGASQLEKEIARNDWLVVPFNRRILFDTPIEKRWQKAAALMGIDINQLSDQVGHA